MRRYAPKPGSQILPTISVREVCELFGYTTSRVGRWRMCKRIVARLKRANGKLDAYDPRNPRGNFTDLTMTTLRMLFPERFDKPNEMIRHLEQRLKQYDERFESIEKELAAEKRISRKRDDLLSDAIDNLSQVIVRTRTRKESAA